MPIFFVFASVKVTFWWTVVLAIGIEAVALWYLFGLSPRQAVWASLLINTGTALLGILVYPLIGALSYPVLAPLVSETFGQSMTVELAAYCIAAAVIDTPLELILLARLSTRAQYGLSIGLKAVGVFFFANLISAGVLLAALYLGSVKRPVTEATRQAIEQVLVVEVDFAQRVMRDLPAHRDSEGRIDPEWRSQLMEEVKDLNLLDFSVGTGGSVYYLVPYSIADRTVASHYLNNREEYFGEALVQEGRIEFRRAPGQPVETMDVLYYRLEGEIDGRPVGVTAVLAAPQPDR